MYIDGCAVLAGLSGLLDKELLHLICPPCSEYTLDVFLRKDNVAVHIVDQGRHQAENGTPKAAEFGQTGSNFAPFGGIEDNVRLVKAFSVF